MIGQCVEQEDDDEEVEGIEDPAEYAGGNGQSPTGGSGVRASSVQIRLNVHEYPVSVSRMRGEPSLLRVKQI